MKAVAVHLAQVFEAIGIGVNEKRADATPGAPHVKDTVEQAGFVWHSQERSENAHAANRPQEMINKTPPIGVMMPTGALLKR